MRKITYLMIIFFALLFSCSGKRDNETLDSSPEENTVNLEINRDKPNESRNHDRQTVETTPAVSEPQEQVLQYLSGRTELLALPAVSEISARGFSLGDLYRESSASIEEINLIDNCSRFIEGLSANKFIADLVFPDARGELKEYCNYFIIDRIKIESFQFSKPLISGNERLVKLLIFPEKRSGWLYLRKNGENWMLSGLEVDVRDQRPERGDELWAPTVNPSPYGY